MDATTPTAGRRLTPPSAAITRPDLQNFYKRYFFPKNVMLAIWGDFDSAQMKAQVEKLFADWTVEQPEVPAFPKVTAKDSAGTYLAVKTDVTQTFFTVGGLGGEFRDKDYPALETLADILGGGFHSRLMEIVRTKMGSAYDISASWAAGYDHPGTVSDHRQHGNAFHGGYSFGGLEGDRPHPHRRSERG